MFRERTRDVESVDDVTLHRRRAHAWLDRAREKIDSGEYEVAAGALIGAKQAVNALLPVNARVA